MLKQSPSRNLRSKGFKVKHAIQICLLLAICIWLLYQVKHSHEKKKVYEESAAKKSEKVQSGHEIIKLGRKDLHPQLEETALETLSTEEELEEEVEETKTEETEDEGRGGGDDEIDGRDQERVEEEESEQVEDLIDEEDREREIGSEELENEGNGNQNEDMSLSEDEAQIEGERNTREAREEHYKGDDASSAVVQNTQTIANEFRIGSLRKVKEHEVENAEKIEVEQDKETNGTEEVIVDTKDSGLEVRDSVTAEIGAFENGVHSEEKGNGFGSADSDVGSNSNSSIKVEANVEPKVNNDSTLALMETPGSLNGTDTPPSSIHDLDITSNERQSYLQAGGQNERPNAESGQPDFNLTPSMITDHLGGAKSKMSLLSGSESVVSEESSASTNANENDNAIHSEDSEANGRIENTEESASSLATNENVDAVQDESSDSSEASFYQEDREDKTIWEALAEIEIGMNDHEDAAENHGF